MNTRNNSIVYGLELLISIVGKDFSNEVFEIFHDDENNGCFIYYPLDYQVSWYMYPTRGVIPNFDSPPHEVGAIIRHCLDNVGEEVLPDDILESWVIYDEDDS